MTKNELLIKNGHIIDPSTDTDGKKDILVKDGLIAAVENSIAAETENIIDASGLLVMPGFIDMHVHLREPGFEESETISSGCDAAAAGGFTSVCAMPNTSPSTDDAGRVKFILDRARTAKARVYPIGAITRERKGAELVEMAEMAAAGVVGFSDDGCSVANSAVMFNALRYSVMTGKIVICHEEDPDLDKGGQMNESALSAELGLKGMPGIAEEIFIGRDIAIAEYVGSPIHITHISTKGSVEIIRAAKKRGVRVSCDVTPHHLVLTEELVATFDPRYKMNPPLRKKKDVDALREGLSDGTIDAIATDHAPHAKEIKEIEFIFSAFGITGLETAIPILQKELIDNKIVSWKELVLKMSSNPSGILGIPGGTLKTGTVADITIYDPNRRWTVEPAKMKSRSQNTAFAGWEMPGKAFATIVGGKLNLNK